MALVPTIVTNTTAQDIILVDVTTFDDKPIHLLPGVPTDLLQIADVHDLEKSAHLARLFANGTITSSESFDPVDTQENETNLLKNWILSNDLYVAFASSTYSGTHGTPVSVVLNVTNGVGITDLLNSTTTVLVTASGSASGKTINGHASPVTITFVKGTATLLVNASSSGSVILALSAATHPSVTLSSAGTTTVTLA